MIVPRSRLIFWVAVVVLPFALLAAVIPGALPVAALIISVFLLIVIGDAARAFRPLAGIAVELPPIVRWTKARPATLTLRIRNERRQKIPLRLALAWPPQIKVEATEMDALLPTESEWSLLAWPCQPLQRGQFQLTAVFVEGVSPLGFWAGRKSIPVRSEIRVYPNLASDRRNLAALFLNRGSLGLHAQRQVGQGRDFEKLREYIPGDGYDEIHWKATARRGRPVTKVFQLEKTQEVYVILDTSRLSARPTGAEADSEAILERFINAALTLGLAAEQQGDLFGLLAFSDKVDVFLRAKNGAAHYHACRDALYLLQPKIVTPDFEELATFLRLRLRRRALLIVLTALDDPNIAENFTQSLDLFRRQHLVMVNMVPPAGVASFFSRPNLAGTDELYEALGGHLRWHKLAEFQKTLQRQGVSLALPEGGNLGLALVTQYLKVKQRQML